MPPALPRRLLLTALTACLLAALTACARPASVSPCAALQHRAVASCEQVATRCTTVEACLRALPGLADPPALFPSDQPCDRAIVERLAQAAPADVPALLAALDGDARTRSVLLGVLPLTGEPLADALAAIPTRTATIALGGIAGGRMGTGRRDEGRRRAALARFRARPDAREVVLWQGDSEGTMWRGLLDDREPPARLDEAIERLRPEDDWFTICDLAWVSSRRTAERSRQAFARLAVTARSGLARECALGATIEPGPGADLVEMAYGPHAARQLEAHRCASQPVDPVAPWRFRRDQERAHPGVELASWQAHPVSGPFGRRTDRRAFLCFDRPPPPAPVTLPGGTLALERGHLSWTHDGAAWQVETGASTLALHAHGEREAYVVGAYVHGDDILLQQIVVWHRDGAGTLTELAGLPRSDYRWSFVDHDGALVVATASVGTDGEGRTVEGRAVSAVSTEGASAVDCW